MLETATVHTPKTPAGERASGKHSFTNFRQLMEERRAIRIFDGSPVPEEVVRECLSLTLLTPSSSNLQPYEFYWVRSPELKPDLVRAFIGQSAARTASEIIVCVARTATWDTNRKKVIELLKSYGSQVTPANLRYYEVTCKIVYNQGVLGLYGLYKRIANVFLGMSRAIVRSPSSRTEMKIWAVKSAAMACQSLVLAFQAAGYDTCPMEGLDWKRIKKILKLESDAVVVMGIAVGKRSYNGVVSPRVRLGGPRFIKEV